MDNTQDLEKIATARAYKYLQLLEDKNSKSSKLYQELLSYLESGHIEGKVTIADLLRVAFGELGYMCKDESSNLEDKVSKLDKDGKPIIHNKKFNKYADFFDKQLKGNNSFYGGKKQNEDWCTIFYHWCLYNSLGEEKTRVATNVNKLRSHGAGVPNDYFYYADFPQTMEMIFNNKAATAGDQAFFFTKEGIIHTGLVVANYGGYVYILEGNTNPQVGDEEKIIPRGKGVCLKRYSLDRVDIEFRRPAFKGISPIPHPYDYKEVSKKISELYDMLKEELALTLTPEESVTFKSTPEEIEQTKLQIAKHKLQMLTNSLKSKGIELGRVYGGEGKDIINGLKK